MSRSRFPITIMRYRRNRQWSFWMWDASVAGSLVLPSNTSTATGQPTALHTRTHTISTFPFLRLRACLNCAKGQVRPLK